MSRKTFKRKQAVAWATRREVNSFVEELLDGWEAAKLTEAQVLAKVTAVLDDAHSGSLTLKGKQVYVSSLAVRLKAMDVPMPDRPEAETPASAASKYV